MDNTTFGGDVPEVPKWTGPPSTVVATLILLYFGLGLTMLSVGISILHKYLLNQYILEAKPEPEAGNERQHRLFQRVTALFPDNFILLTAPLQLALLFISCALAVYTWEINRIITGFLLLFIIFTVIAYTVVWILFQPFTDASVKAAIGLFNEFLNFFCKCFKRV